IYLRALLVGNAGFIDNIVGVYRVHGKNISFNLKCDSIINNLQDKINIKNLAVVKYGYDKIQMNTWLQEQSIRTISFYLLNSEVDILDFKKLYFWISKNLSEIISKLDSKRHTFINEDPKA